jgi:hypothetical protein
MPKKKREDPGLQDALRLLLCALRRHKIERWYGWLRCTTCDPIRQRRVKEREQPEAVA